MRTGGGRWFLSVQDQYPEKYKTLLHDETWAFIERTNSWYPPESIDWSVAQIREAYNAMCREFSAGRPKGVEVEDRSVPARAPAREIGTRRYLPTGRTIENGPDLVPGLIVYFHGGGFVVGGLDSHDDVCAEICHRTGFAVISADYRLSPEHLYPSDFEDAVCVFQSLKAVKTKRDVPVILVGDSAGGNIAAALSHECRMEGFQPDGQVLIYPGLGSNLDQGTFIEHASAPLLSTEETKFYKNIRTGGDERLLQDASCCPLNDRDFSGLPPTIVISAECDPLSGDGKDYCDRILAVGGKAHWVNERGLVHGYLRARHSVKRARDSFTRIVDAISMLGRREWTP